MLAEIQLRSLRSFNLISYSNFIYVIFKSTMIQVRNDEKGFVLLVHIHVSSTTRSKRRLLFKERPA